jgi:hypothetical protein
MLKMLIIDVSLHIFATVRQPNISFELTSKMQAIEEYPQSDSGVYMASCNATRSNGIKCGQTLKRCKFCGATGCDTGNGNCPNSIRDKTGHCKKCGKIPETTYV